MHETRSDEGCLLLAVYRKPNVLFSAAGDISARAAQAATKMVPICSTPTPTLCNWALLQVKLQPIGRQCARMAFARTTQTKPHLVDPQSLFVWHTPPKLLRAEARVAAQFATKVRLIRVTSFGRDACPVNMQLRGVRSHQQNVFRSCKPPQCAGRPTGHRAHLSFKLASAPPFGENVSSRYGGSRPLAVSLDRSPPSLSPSCCGVGLGALSACSWRCLCRLVSRSSVSV